MSGGNSGSKEGKNTEGGKYYNSMNIEKQSRHIPGAKEYNPNKSSIDISIEKLDSLIKENISTAIYLDGGKLIMEFPINIGTYKSEDGKILEKTNIGILHRSKTGYHLVPAKKKED